MYRYFTTITLSIYVILNLRTDRKIQGVYLERLSEVRNQTDPKHHTHTHTHTQTTLVAHVSTLIAIHFLTTDPIEFPSGCRKVKFTPSFPMDIYRTCETYETSMNDMKFFIVSGSHPQFPAIPSFLSQLLSKGQVWGPDQKLLRSSTPSLHVTILHHVGFAHVGCSVLEKIHVRFGT